MYILYVRFKVFPLAARFLLCDRDGKVSVKKAEAMFPESARQEIADFPGLKWKIWSIGDRGREGAGFYLFDTLEEAEARARFAKKVYPRDGLYGVRCTVYEVLEDCSRATRAPIDAPANPDAAPDVYQRLLREHKNPIIERYRRKK